MVIPSVGPLKRLTIRHDDSGSSPDWFLDKVIVQDARETYKFLATRWLAIDRGDGAISVTLRAG